MLLTSPQNTFSEGDVEARLEGIIANTFAGKRFDLVTVDINEGILNIVLEDTAICSESNAIFRITRHINLRDFEPVRRREINKVKAANRTDPQATFISIRVDSAAGNRIAIAAERQDQIYYAAKEELGMGQEAGNRTYELFTQSTPELQNMSYVIREKCSDGIGITLVEHRFSLAIKQVNALEYIENINYLIQLYDD